MRAAVVRAFDQPLAIEQVLDGSAPAPHLVFRMGDSPPPRLGHDHRHAPAHA